MTKIRVDEGLRYAAEAVPTMGAFLLILIFYPSQNNLTRNANLIELWAIPIFFYVLAGFISKVSDDGVKIPAWVYYLFSRVAAGAWLGLSFRAVLILNLWYADPSQGTWEPLFTATGLSGAGVMAAQRHLATVRAKAEAAEEKRREVKERQTGGSVRANES